MRTIGHTYCTGETETVTLADRDQYALNRSHPIGSGYGAVPASPQSARADYYRDLSETASGMAVSTADDRTREDLADVADDGDYVKDDGTVTLPSGTYRVGKNGTLYPVRERTRWTADVTADVKVSTKNGVGYIRSGKTRSVQVWETADQYRAACRCGWTHATHKAPGPFPQTYDVMYGPALTLLKWVGIHDAWHRAND